MEDVKRPTPVSRTLRGVTVSALVAGLGTIVLGGAGTGCLSRPVVHQEPTTKINFTAVVRQAAIDKVDILFGIDNSASMGDKQVILSEAIPDLLKRLFTPNCLNDKGAVVGVSDAAGKCATGKIEFPAVHDMHIGIVSSSLGGRGGDSCSPTDMNPANPGVNAHNDDRGHLISRAGDNESNPPEAKSPANFLAWLPNVDANKGKVAPPVPPQSDVTKLQNAFADMVKGVHEHGCGYEAQMESVYRFLVQPDPYDRITKKGDIATLEGVDKDLLQQRKDFLRPDSLVAVILVTDENESTVDPISFGGRAYFYTSTTSHVKNGTSQCSAPPGPGKGPNDPNCISCFLSAASSDSTCKALDDQTDNFNERFLHMKERFGVDPRFPVDRYVKGFSQRTVPDRNGEHPKDDKGTPSFNYVGKPNCTNPLFATNLPTDPNADLCHLTPGPRTADLVFFGLIGGVPWQLLTEEPTNLSANNKAAFKTSLGNDDWTRIIGKDPFAYDFSGIDPHMLESQSPRAGVGADDAHTREWQTNNKDLQYACTFPFPDSASSPNGKKDCTKPEFNGACDCSDPSDSPLCEGTTQTKGKAYPTVSELVVAKALGEQAVVASICPRSNDKSNDDYGYRPAVRSIVDRLKNALANQCLPQPLVADPEGKVPCLILETLGVEGPQASACDASKGLKQPDAAVLAKFREQQLEAAGGDAGIDLSKFPVCEVIQLTQGQLVNGSCSDAPTAGWCYVTGAAAGGSCPQAIKFSPGGNPGVGAKISLQCIEQAPNPDAVKAGDGG
jgi:hypothetical protein